MSGGVRRHLPMVVALGLALLMISVGSTEALLTRAAPLFIASLGALATFSLRHFDVSTSANVAFAGAATLLCLPWMPAPLAVLVGCLATVASGLVLGWIVVRFPVPSLLASFVMAWLVLAATFALTGDLATDAARAVRPLAWSDWPVPPFIVIALVLGLAATWTFERTRLGPELATAGRCRPAAEHAGVPTWAYVVGAFLVGGALTGLAGAIALARSGSVSPAVVTSLQLDIFLSLFACGAAIPGRVPSVWRLFVGVMCVTMLEFGLARVDLSDRSTDLIKAVALIGALLLHYRTTLRLRLATLASNAAEVWGG